MTVTNPSFDIFGSPEEDNIRVGYISPDRGLVSNVTVCEANAYAKLNPGTIFIFRNREKIQYLGINEVNKLTTNDLLTVVEKCDGVSVAKTCGGLETPKVIFGGGGGLGAKANPVIVDGSVIAVDLIEGGFGYQYEPIVDVKDPCGVGAGVVAKAVMGELVTKFVVYDDEDDFEDYKICPEEPITYGTKFSPSGREIGKWNPEEYLNSGETPFRKQIDDYIKFLNAPKNPFWTSRTESPKKVTSKGIITRAKYDVSHWAWGANVDPQGEYDEAADSDKGNIVNDRVWKFGVLWRTDLTNFMNANAISPIPMSNVKDEANTEYYFEWDVEFPYAGDYIFKIQCDNEGSLYVDNKKKATYKIGTGGAAGNILSPPEETQVTIDERGFKKVRVDLRNYPKIEKVAKPQELSEFPTSNDIEFSIATSTLFGASIIIDGLDINLEKSYGANNNVKETFERKVEFGKVYDVIITSNNKRVGTLPSTNKEFEFDGLHPANNPINVTNNGKRIALKDGDGDDTNASFTIDNGNGTFAPDGRSIVGTGEQTLTLSWSDRRQAGRAINSIRLGSTVWQRTGSSGSVTRTFTLGGGIGQLGGQNNKARLRVKGERVLEMEDIPNTVEGGGGVGVFFDDLVVSVSQGRFFDINGLNCKFTLGEPKATTGTSSQVQGETRRIFNTMEFIDKANRELWRTNTLRESQRENSAEAFLNRYGVSPFDTTIEHETSYPGTHTIKWHNVNFPISGEYDIGIAVDDNVTLKIGNEVNIFKQGFFEGTTNSTGSSLYRRFITAGNYTIVAELNQIPGGKFGLGPDDNPMALAINISTSFNEVDEKISQSWNQNPLGIAVVIEAPEPPIPQEPVPIQEGRCPSNPFWSTRFSSDDDSKWHPVAFASWTKFKNRYAMSPIPPYSTENTSGGGKTYTTKWKIDIPYDGFYKLKAEADDKAKFWILPEGEPKDQPTLEVGIPENGVVPSKMVGLTTTGEHNGKYDVIVEVENFFQGTTETISQRVFSTLGWGAQGTKKQVPDGSDFKDITFNVSSATLYGAQFTLFNGSLLNAPLINETKEFGGANFNSTHNLNIEKGKVYDVIFTSQSSGSNRGIEFTGLHPVNNPINVTNNGKRLALRDGDGTDTNASFTIDSGSITFASDGRSLVGSGDATLTLTWNDARRAGRAIDRIKIGSVEWLRSGSGGTITRQITIGATSNNASVQLKNKDGADNVVQMEDFTDESWDDITCSATDGRFYDFNGRRCKFTWDGDFKEVLVGTSSGTSKDGVTYSGPDLFHLPFTGWGPFMNKFSVSPFKLKPDSPVVNYTWNNVDFPEDGDYEIAFQMDHSATLFLDDQIVATNIFRGQNIAEKHKVDMTGEARFKSVKVNKGKHTLTVKPTVYTEESGGPVGFIDALFQQSPNYVWQNNPSGFAIEIRRNVEVRGKTETGEDKTLPWTVNPISVAGVLIPPPCPREVEGKGIVKDVDIIEPGNGFPNPPTDPVGLTTYPVSLEVTKIIPTNPGIGYTPGDVVVVGVNTFSMPPLDPFGRVPEIPLTGVGVTEIPDVDIITETGVGFEPGVPKIVVRRDPLDVPADQLIQVTDLVGLKQTGYYQGRPYYGAVFFKDGLAYAGYYETAGQLIRVYDTLQESIDGEVTTAPSAIQRQGTDVNSNNPRLNIPGTPQNLTE